MFGGGGISFGRRNHTLLYINLLSVYYKKRKISVHISNTKATKN